LVDGLALVRAHQLPSPAAALVSFLAATAPGPVVLTADMGRMIEEGAPRRAVIPVTSEAELLQNLAGAGPNGALVTSEALGPGTLPALRAAGYRTQMTFTKPRSRYVDPLWNELALVAVVR